MNESLLDRWPINVDSLLSRRTLGVGAVFAAVTAALDADAKKKKKKKKKKPGCTTDCVDKNCGSDGCGGSCGTCDGNAVCGSAGQCVNPESYEFVTQWGEDRIDRPRDVAVDSAGHVYVVDFLNDFNVHKFSDDGTHLLDWGPRDSDEDGHVFRGNGIVHAGDSVIVASGNFLVQRFSETGVFQHSIGGPGGSGIGQFDTPNGLAVDSSDRVYVADQFNHRVQVFNAGGGFVAQWGSFGAGNGQFSDPWDIAIDADDNIFVVDHGNHRIQKFAPDRTHLLSWGAEGDDAGQFLFPQSIAVDAAGNVYVADTSNGRVQKFDNDGDFITLWSIAIADDSFPDPVASGIAVDSAGHVYVGDIDSQTIKKYRPVSAGSSLATFRGSRGNQNQDRRSQAESHRRRGGKRRHKRGQKSRQHR